MKRTNPFRSTLCRPRLRRSILVVVTILISYLPGFARAESATWKQSPANGNWFNLGNWTPTTIPDGSTEIATFKTSNVTDVTLHPSPSGSDLLDSIIFQNGASAFTIRPQYLDIGGAGISNLSGRNQNFVNDVYQNLFLVGSRLIFSGNATAGTQCTYTNNPGAIPNTNACDVIFVDDANAGSSLFINNASATSDSTSAGNVFFENNASASQATIINHGGTGSALSGATVFFDSSTADAATIIVNGSTGSTIGGVLAFDNDSTGGTSTVQLNGNATLTLGNHNRPGVTIGSLEGDGIALLAPNNLTIGTNNSSHTFSGLIADGEGFSGGSLSKVGTGTLTLTGANSYTGGTTVRSGTLMLGNRRGSATGTGSVAVRGGTLAGSGHIDGSLQVRSNAPSAQLAPGTPSKSGVLEIGGTLTMQQNSVYQFGLFLSPPASSRVSTVGVSLGRGASFALVTKGSGQLPLGTVLSVIDNLSATPIAGTFANLADGTVLSVAGNNFVVSYEGGDGNDLTLTVVP